MSLSLAKLKSKLRLNPDRVEVLFAPDRLKLRRQSARGNLEHSYTVNENSWQAAGAVLTQALRELDWRDMPASVCLSNHFVRYALVPGSAKLRNRAEHLAAARHQLHALFGEQADRWLIVPTAVGSDCHLAAAVDSELVGSLAEIISSADLRLRRIEPILVSAFNNACGRIDRKPTWLMTAESERACIAYFENGQWRLIRNERLRAPLEEELPLMLERLILAENAQPGRVLFLGPKTPPQLGAGWSVETLAPTKRKAA